MDNTSSFLLRILIVNNSLYRKLHLYICQFWLVVLLVYVFDLFPGLTLFFSIVGLLTSCTTNSAEHLKSYPVKTLSLPSGKTVKVYIANSYQRQKDGLSKIKSEDFSSTEGMLFPEDRMMLRQFWMPETHFDLDVIFMNEDYYVLDIHRSLKHYPAKGERGIVPLSKEVFSQHVLEVRSDSPLAKEIQPGMTLNFSN